VRPPANPSAARNALSATTLRVFFALWPDSAARDALAALARDVAARIEGRSPPIANMHVTVAFVGEIAPARVVDLCAIGAAVAAMVPPFRLTLDRPGTFRGSGIAWAGPSSVPTALVKLARNLDEALSAAGFRTERRAFHPHVTLARRCRKSPGDALPAPIAWTVTTVALNQSEPGSGASRYLELSSWPLALPAADEPAS
jgi:RNA 2',3'-cyclic 3'-phosphodiesterase